MDTEGRLIYAGRDRLIATLGLRDHVIVDTGDCVLIARREAAERMKELHPRVSQTG